MMYSLHFAFLNNIKYFPILYQHSSKQNSMQIISTMQKKDKYTASVTQLRKKQYCSIADLKHKGNT